MKNLIFTFFAILVCYGNVWAQCPSQNLTFKTQQEINDFGSLYPNCTILNGNLSVGEISPLNDIDDLTPLAQLEGIGGDLTIRGNNFLVTLTGLESLEAIGGTLEISDNTALENLDGLETLGLIANSLSIFDNVALNTLEALESLYFIGGSVFIVEQDLLTDLSGLDNLLILGNSLVLSQNPALSDLTALSNITFLGGKLEIVDHPALTDLAGLENITNIGGELYINNTGLKNFAELSNLTAIGGGLRIIFNNDLTELTGLDNIDVNTIVFVEVYNNTNLSVCGVKSVCDYLSQVAPYNISGNALGCNDPNIVCSKCPVGDITLSSQQEVNEFGLLYSNCNILNNSLTISGNDISDLTPLIQLEGIGGDLTIKSNTSLNTLTGLDSLKSIGGTLRLENNIAINDLTGLNKLNSIGNNLAMADNDNLKTLVGLESLSFIGGAITIVDHISLANLNGLDNLLVLGGSLILQDIKALNDLSALSNLTVITGDLEISSTPALTNLTGLENLTAVLGQLTIGSTGVKSLKALQNLTGVALINIYYNNNLTELTGLDNIDPNIILNLELLGNSNLSICDLDNICLYLAQQGAATISGNAPGCDTPENVCPPCKLIDSEDFEEGWGIWIDGGSDAQRVSKIGYATSNTYSINIQDNSSQSVITTQNLDFTRYSFVSVDFSFYAVSMDANESFFVEVSVDGGQNFDFGKEFKVGEDFENNTNYTVSVPFPMPLTPETKIRFRCNASSNSDDVYLDDISITACTDTCPLEALPCDDGDPCTAGEAYDTNCNCTGGIFQDEDGDGVCDNDDICPDFDNNLIGTPCDDGDICTFNDRYDGDCDCRGTYIGDNDLDGICDTEDPCPDQAENVCNDYCEARGICSIYEYIQSVELGVNNETGNDGGYGDYTYLPGLIIGGYNVPITLTAGFTDEVYNEKWVVWIDLNKDGDFDDAGEEVFSGTSHGTQPLKGIIRVPASFGLTRMRVAMRWKKDPHPCGQFRYGEVEDYIVDLGALPNSKLSSDNTIQSYPNPAKSYINVDLHDVISNGNTQSVTAMIFSMNGQQVSKEELDAMNVLTINTHHLPEASYVLHLRMDDGRTFTSKFVKL